jgi:hypothetical protein
MKKGAKNRALTLPRLSLEPTSKQVLKEPGWRNTSLCLFGNARVKPLYNKQQLEKK